ncbi:MAG TPA: hypothetical protein VN750_02890 [Steroidobacteraceae bacterium]|nr:hypothetical protein [Steroidobacteraceae bacterium]
MCLRGGGRAGAGDALVISTRSVETTRLIKDGETVALGGLTDTQRDM